MINRIVIPIKLAWQTFHKNKVRSTMTVFGVMIGIAMVIIVLSAGNGIKGLILDEISSFGNDWINIEIKVPSTGKNSQENASSLSRGVSITTLTYEDAEAILELKNIKNIYAGVTTQSVISYKQEKERPSVFGVSAQYKDITNFDMQEGRFYTEEEERGAAQVVVIGSDIRNSLFGNSEAVGKSVKVDGKSYRVVGVAESLGATGFINMDEIIYIPLRTVQKKMMGIDHVLWIIAQTVDNTKAEVTAQEITWLMRQRHDISDPDKDDFAVTTMSEALEIVGTIITGITWLLVALSAISLLVGGVGIMNVMYVSVAERTFEIGLRKSVGARRSEILWQFLVESAIITLLGGLVGIILGISISYLIATVAQYLGYAWTFSVSLFSILLSTSFSAFVGVFFGYYPAKRAAELDPIEAIRQE